MDQPTHYTPVSPPPSTTPASPSPTASDSTPIDSEEAFTHYALSKQVTLRYGIQTLTGTLHLITHHDYINGLYSRFFDISPSDPPAFTLPPAEQRAFGEALEPYVIIHVVLGRSWAHGQDLPSAHGGLFSSECVGKESGDHFVAVIDDFEAWAEVDGSLGECDLGGTFQPSTPSLEDLILALPCLKPLPHPHPIKFRMARLLTLPIPTALHALITAIRAALLPDPETGLLRRSDIQSRFPQILCPKTRLLSTEHPLYGFWMNVGLWGKGMWHNLCYPSRAGKKEKEEAPLPEAYYQEVFDDLQGRKRVPGVEGRLVGVEERWYVE